MTGRALDSGGSDTVAELTQSRGASTSEAVTIFHAQMNAFRSRVAAISGSRLSRFALVVGAGALGATLISAADSRWMRELSPVVIIVGTLVSAAVILLAWTHVYYRRCAEAYCDSLKANRRLRIEEHAIIATDYSGVAASIPWTAISDIVVSRDFLSIYLSAVEAIAVPKAACEHQDVDAFCAELQRRWQGRRAQSIRGPRR